MRSCNIFLCVSVMKFRLLVSSKETLMRWRSKFVSYHVVILNTNRQSSVFFYRRPFLFFISCEKELYSAFSPLIYNFEENKHAYFVYTRRSLQCLRCLSEHAGAPRHAAMSEVLIAPVSFRTVGTF